MRAGSCVVERLRVRLPAGRCGGIGVSNGGLRVTPRTCRRHGRESSSTRRSLFGNGSPGKLDAGAFSRGDPSMNGANPRMDVQNIIDELRFSVEHIVSEEELLHVITERLTALRQSFSSHRSLFTPSHIEFLKSFAGISDQLRSFIELKEELVDLD